MEVQDRPRPASGSASERRKPESRTRVQLAPGEKVPGTDYLIVRWSGDSLLGPTYEASRSGDARARISIKVFTNEVGGDVRAVKMGKAEARVASGLKSPYITEVLEFSELTDGRLFQVIELVEGKRLADLAGEVDPGRAVGILRQVCKGLSAAHSVGVVHGDIKPDNIWVMTREGREDSVKITDFGIASLVGEDAADAPPHYMAPERLDGAVREPAADMYALGCVAYELLTGVPPFTAEDPDALRRAHRESKPPPMAAVASCEVPPALEKVVQRCLAKKPGDRYANMQDLEAAICEAQIEAGLRTRWDHLPVPEVAAARKKKIEQGMPEPLARLSPAVEAADDEEEQEELETRIYSESMFDGIAEELAEPAAAVPAKDERRGPPAWLYAAAAAVLLAGLFAAFGGGDDDSAPPTVAQAVDGDDRGPTPSPADQRPRPSPGEEPDRPVAPAVAGEPAGGEGGVAGAPVDGPGEDEPATPDATPGLGADEPAAAEGGEEPMVLEAGTPGEDDGAEAPADEEPGTAAPSPTAAPSDAGEPARDPARANELARQGQAAVQQGRRDAGQKLFFQALEHDSRNHRALAGLSDLYFDQGSYSKAVTFAKRAVASSPGNAGYRMKLGDALFKVLKYADARKQYEKAERLGHSGARGRISALDKKLGK